MAKRTKKSKRRRMSSEEIKKRSQTQQGGGGNWFNLPDGVGQWMPEKKGKYDIDIVPYEVKSDNHPNDVESGVIWFQHPFKVHHGVGVDSKSIVCPTSVGKKCPICEEVARLSKDYDENEDVIKSIKGKNMMAYNILDPEDPEKIAIFAISPFKFSDLLNTEIDENDDEDVSNFFDVTELGRTLRVRFSEDTFSGHKFLKASKIDFIEREEMDEDEILDKTVCLDEMFAIPEYDKLKEMFLQTDAEDDEEEEDDEPAPRKRKVTKKSSKKAPPPEDDEDDDMDDEDDWDDDEDEDEEPAPKKSKKKSSKKAPPPEDDDDEDDEDLDDDEDDEEEEEAPAPKKRVLKKKSSKKAPPPEEDDEDDDDEPWDDDEDDDDEEEEPPKKKSSKKKVTKKKVTKKKPTKKAPPPEDDDDDEDWDDDDWDDDEDE